MSASFLRLSKYRMEMELWTNSKSYGVWIYSIFAFRQNKSIGCFRLCLFVSCKTNICALVHFNYILVESCLLFIRLVIKSLNMFDLKMPYVALAFKWCTSFLDFSLSSSSSSSWMLFFENNWICNAHYFDCFHLNALIFSSMFS